jgi:hypothetical protein
LASTRASEVRLPIQLTLTLLERLFETRQKPPIPSLSVASPLSEQAKDMADNLRATKGGQTTHYLPAGLNGTGLARVLGLPFQI